MKMVSRIIEFHVGDLFPLPGGWAYILGEAPSSCIRYLYMTGDGKHGEVTEGWQSFAAKAKDVMLFHLVTEKKSSL